MSVMLVKTMCTHKYLLCIYMYVYRFQIGGTQSDNRSFLVFIPDSFLPVFSSILHVFFIKRFLINHISQTLRLSHSVVKAVAIVTSIEVP